jgi:hypothetical protein
MVDPEIQSVNEAFVRYNYAEIGKLTTQVAWLKKSGLEPQ